MMMMTGLVALFGLQWSSRVQPRRGVLFGDVASRAGDLFYGGRG